MAKIEDAVVSLIGKFDVAFLLRWGLPFCLILACLCSAIFLHPTSFTETVFGITAPTSHEKVWLSRILVGAILGGILYIVFALVFFKRSKALTKPSDTEPMIIEQLDDLSNEEKVLLGICLYRKNRLFLAPIASPIVHHLIIRGLVEQAGTMGYPQEFPFRVSDIAWKLLKQRASDFKLPPTSTEANVQIAWNRVIGNEQFF
ncbi:MAG: super-infection exclusion protein B [Candidatus Obscuribacterales bacterium]|nr:super-infection exclusion protein B [Candidatus Obscuribacterales bacterium]